MIVRPFQRADLAELRLQPAQAWMQPMLREDSYAEHMVAAESFSAFDREKCIAVAGLTVVWPGRAHLTALISDDVGPGLLLLLHRATKAHLDRSKHRRIEATVEGNFAEGHRWLKALGFQLETPGGMKGYMPNGGTSFLYARTQ